MWPFRKRLDLRSYGFKKGSQESVSFDFTDEERREIEAWFKIFEGVAVQKDNVDRVQRATTAQALSQYAKGQIDLCELGCSTGNRSSLIERAVSACFKACSIYPLPIFDYDLACLLDMVGEGAQAKELFGKFLAGQANFTANQIDDVLLMGRDIETAMKDARARLQR